MDEKELHEQICEIIQHNAEICQKQIISTPGNMSYHIAMFGSQCVYYLSNAILPEIEKNYKHGAWVHRTVFDRTNGGIFIYYCAYGTNA